MTRRLYAGALAGNAIVEGKTNIGSKMDSRVRSVVEAQPSGQISMYHTDYSWFIAAAVLELVCIVLILPMYRGWWTIGRPVSFSPLEIAKVSHRLHLSGKVARAF